MYSSDAPDTKWTITYADVVAHVQVSHYYGLWGAYIAHHSTNAILEIKSCAHSQAIESIGTATTAEKAAVLDTFETVIRTPVKEVQARATTLSTPEPAALPTAELLDTGTAGGGAVCTARFGVSPEICPEEGCNSLALRVGDVVTQAICVENLSFEGVDTSALVDGYVPAGYKFEARMPCPNPQPFTPNPTPNLNPNPTPERSPSSPPLQGAHGAARFTARPSRGNLQIP